jgi:exodeoxyribonuclease V alpha subunit
VAATVVELLKTRLPRTYGDAVRDAQVVTPSRRGLGGTENLNKLLQDALNPKDKRKGELRFRGHVFRVHDRVMQNRNNYDIEWEKKGNTGYGVFNGDIGVIEEINAGEETVSIRFDDKVAVYPFSLLEELEHAYAITVHKSQGSEYGTVIVPLYSCPTPLMTRNLIYTAVTRARTRVILVGREEIVMRMIANNRQDLRYTLLTERLMKRYL